MLTCSLCVRLEPYARRCGDTLRRLAVSARRLFEFGEYPLVDFEIGGAVEDEPDQARVLQTVGLLPYRPERHPRRLLDRIAEDPGRDGGEGDGRHAVLLGERE